MSHNEKQCCSSSRQQSEVNRATVPQTDIVETDEAILLTADMPGVDQEGVDVTLEKRVLTITGTVSRDVPADVKDLYSESTATRYERSFALSEEISREEIAAELRDGVLRITLPKVKQALTQKVNVTSA